MVAEVSFGKVCLANLRFNEETFIVDCPPAIALFIVFDSKEAKVLHKGRLAVMRFKEVSVFMRVSEERERKG